MVKYEKLVFIYTIILGIALLWAIIKYLIFDQYITYNIFENHSLNPDPVYTVKGKDTLGLFVIGSYFFGAIAFLFSTIPLTRTLSDNKVRDISERLEKFYKPAKQILDNTNNMSYSTNQVVVNIRKLKQYDHLAKNLDTKILFRECTITKGKDADQLRKQLKDLRIKVEKHIEDYEKELYKLYNL